MKYTKEGIEKLWKVFFTKALLVITSLFVYLILWHSLANLPTEWVKPTMAKMFWVFVAGITCGSSVSWLYNNIRLLLADYSYEVAGEPKKAEENIEES